MINSITITTALILCLTSTGIVSASDKADVSRDDLNTIKYVGEEHVKKAFPGKAIEFESPKVNWYSSGKKKAVDGKGEVQEGGYNARFRVGGGQLKIRKLQLAKKDGKWQVVNQLKATQLHAAHPQVAPFRNKPRYTLRPVAAQHFEKNFYQQLGGWQKIREPLLFSCSGGDKPGQPAWCEVPYGVYYKGEYKINGSFLHTKCSVKTYLFKQKNDKWLLDTILPADKKIDRKTFKVIDRKGDIWGC